jgi:large subunit ribosomal protein L25
MQEIKLKADVREEQGSSASKKLRRANRVPAVVYKKGTPTVLLQVDRKALHSALHTKAGSNVLINLEIQGEAAKKESKTKQDTQRAVIIKEIQHHPLTGEILHVDFNQISLTEAIKVEVPIEAKGESVGVKEGGVLEYLLHKIEVECLPTQIPEKIFADISGLKIGDSIAIKDLKLPQAVKVLQAPETLVISVAAPKELKVEEVAAPEEGVQEPEVIKQKKPESEEEAQQAEEKSGKKEKEAEK